MTHSVLVVDDDPLLCRLLERMLTLSGYSVTLASDGEDALASIAADLPDLVITDLQIPRMTGWGLITHLHEHYPLLPILVVSAVARGPDLDGIPFLAKPFALATFIAMVQEQFLAA